MLSTNKLKKIKSNFPVLVGDNIVSKSICNLLIKEISNSKSFDDMIMGGRSRINKGSKNFNSYIKNSVNSAKLFKLFNSKTFYKKIESIFKTLKFFLDLLRVLTGKYYTCASSTSFRICDFWVIIWNTRGGY